MPRRSAPPAAAAPSSAAAAPERKRGPAVPPPRRPRGTGRGGGGTGHHAGRPVAAPWPVTGMLFPPLDAAAQTALARLPEALERVRPLSAAHRRSLPEDIAALSRALTAERAELRRPYWSRPAFVSAYLYYFLPWNLVRLTRLFRGLPLPPPGQGEALLMDAGSGPLTVPLALWLARPEWRSAPVRVLALDSAAQPLELGRALFAAWAELLGAPGWPVRLERGPLESLAARALPLVRGARARPWLITAANVLNEVRPARGGHAGAGVRDEDAGDAWEADAGDRVDERLERLLEAWSPLLAAPVRRGDDGAGADAGASPALLFVEPGTRLGGTTMMRLREAALAGGLSAYAPCTQDDPCPLARGAWCHFTFSPEGAPQWLAALSARAGLAKRSLSLSPLLLGAPGEEGGFGRSRGDGSAAPEARVLSSPFAVPGVRGQARYACAACGLALLEDAGALPSGACVRLVAGGEGPGRESRPRRDHRSGAQIFAAPARGGPCGKFGKKS
ncbi:small ribosomal subunit Rsm22 family protein [uncultured Desulfovibrio sp.]|uniref:small ribosomal subunit Rsm22 family protein n=3 Tax=uncultured Desulfovibrio sp. TaxID=167968 RepID=UPI00261D77FA|nr:small ribosomal subunit Rsm22 family protein [uncultured Desulfovibrio sp.]